MLEKELETLSDELSNFQKQLLYYASLCGGSFVTTDRPVELCQDFFAQKQQGNRLVERLPYIIAKIEGYEEQKICVHRIAKLLRKHINQGRLILQFGKDFLGIALLIPNSAVSQPESENDVINKIYTDLEMKLAFLNRPKPDAEAEVIALGLDKFQPSLYLAIQPQQGLLPKLLADLFTMR